MKLGSKLKIKNSIYSVIGIDHYLLDNFFNEKKSWKSFTIIGHGERMSLSNTNDQIILWQLCGSRALENSKLNFNLSGIAAIQFEGERGVSQPLAELLWFQEESSNGFFVLERFFDFSKENIKIDACIYIGELLHDGELELVGK